MERRDTKKRLLNAAEKVLGERGYNGTSVSAICRRAGVAQGTFYRYFKNKEEIYLELVLSLEGELRQGLERAVFSVEGEREQLLAAFEALLSGIGKRARAYQIFREAEFVKVDIPERFYSSLGSVFGDILRRGMEAGGFRPLDPEVVSFGILGVAEFLAMRYLLWERKGLGSDVLSTAKELILGGIDPDDFRCPLREVRLPKMEPRELEGGEATRKAILEAAERLFGQAGFHRTTVFEITYVAGVGQGTFYLYFPSKVAAFVALVEEINRQLRRASRAVTAGLSDRREIECLGFQAFFEFISRHRDAYRIVREAEFVDEGVGRRYYQRLVQGYVRGLKEGMERGEIRPLSPEPLAYALLGIGHFIGLRWIVWERKERIPQEVIKETLDFILHGVAQGPAPEDGALP